MKQTKILQYGFAILLTVAGVALSGAVPTANGQAKKSQPKAADPLQPKVAAIHLRSMSRLE